MLHGFAATIFFKDRLSKGETEIYALDESHFSTEPYLVRGWFKKR